MFKLLLIVLLGIITYLLYRLVKPIKVRQSPVTSHKDETYVHRVKTCRTVILGRPFRTVILGKKIPNTVILGRPLNKVISCSDNDLKTIEGTTGVTVNDLKITEQLINSIKASSHGFLLSVEEENKLRETINTRYVTDGLKSPYRFNFSDGNIFGSVFRSHSITRDRMALVSSITFNLNGNWDTVIYSHYEEPGNLKAVSKES